ncbi:MAG: phage tail protein [Caulobacteraceae bacterium]
MAGRTASSAITRYPGIQVQTSSLGTNIPVGWGTFRCRCNLVDYLDFKSSAQKAAASGKGGATTTGYNYSATVILVVCEGPIDSITQVWVNGKQYAHGSVGSTVANTGSTIATTQAGLSMSLGTIGQTPWSYLVSKHPDHAVGYSGLVLAFAENYALDSGASTPNHSFEVVRTTGFAVGGGYTGPDGDPSLIVADFFQNTRTGVPSWGSGLLDSASLAQYQSYCLASGLLLSPVIDQQRGASDFLTEVLRATNSTVVWSEGLLKFVPYGDTALTGNGKTFTPNLTPVYSLGDDDFIVKDDEAPLTVDIEDQSDAYNVVQCEYLDRTNQYNMAIALASDAANVAQYGMRRKDPDTVHVICTPTVAALSAQLWLQRTLYVRAQYKFDLSWAFALLEPGDIVELTDAGIGLSAYPVRIIQIDEDEKGVLSLTCEDLLVGVSHAPLYAMQASAGTQTNTNVAAPAVEGTVGPLIFNPPTALTPGGVEMWAAVAGSGPNWAGANVWVSFDGTNYELVGQVNGPARYGVTTAAFASGLDPDTTDTLSVDLSASGGVLAGAAQAVADTSGMLCLVDSELVSFSTATPTGTNSFDLTSYIRRGAFNTAIASHGGGAPFVRLDQAIFQFPYLATQAGQTVLVKFQSFNPWGAGVQDLSACVAYSAVPVPATARPPSSSAWTATGTVLSNGGQSTPAIVINGRSDNPSASGIEFFYRQSGTSAWVSAGIGSNSTTQKIITAIAANQTYDVAVAYIVGGVLGQLQVITSSGATSGGGGSGGAPGTTLLSDSVAGSGKTFTCPAGSYSHADIVLTGFPGAGGGTGGKGGFTDHGGGGAMAVVVKGFPVTPGTTAFTYTLPAAVGANATCTATGLSLTATPGANATPIAPGAGGATSGISNTASGATSVTNFAGHNGGLTDTWDGGGAADINGTYADNTTDNSAGRLVGQGGAGGWLGVQPGGGCNLLVIART